MADLKYLEKENELLLEQLHIVQKELEDKVLELTLLKMTLKDSKISLQDSLKWLEGSEEYKIGMFVISISKKPWNIFLLPTKLYAYHHKTKMNSLSFYRKHEISILEEISTYPQACTLMQHLSYRIGLTIKHSNSIKSFLLLPISLYKEVQGFRRERGKKKCK